MESIIFNDNTNNNPNNHNNLPNNPINRRNVVANHRTNGSNNPNLFYYRYNYRSETFHRGKSIPLGEFG